MGKLAILPREYATVSGFAKHDIQILMALAAIQALNQKLNQKDAEIEVLKQSVAELIQKVQTLAAKK
jgi:cell division protein FtsB